MAGQTTRIAHLTDLHLRRRVPGTAVLAHRRSREAAELFVRALADARRRGASLVALTGDLVDIPDYLFDRDRDQAADAELWRAVRQDYRWVREQLEHSGLDWIVLPGNHDSMRLMREEFGDLPMVTDLDGIRVLSFWDREHAGHLPQRILTERRRFDAALADPDDTPQVHLQHFVITPERNAGYPHNYLEAAQLRRRIVASGRVSLVLSGHYHPGATPEVEGSTLFSVTPALTEYPHPYRIFELAGADRVPSWQQVDLVDEPATRPAVFLDRDGCINTLAAYRSGPEAMELIPGAASAIRRLRAAGFAVVVITNQTCIGQGHLTPAVLAEVHDRMHRLLAEEGAWVDAIYASHETDAGAIAERYEANGSSKPSPAMLHQAAQTLHLDLAASWMVGDRPSDVEAGRAAGTRPILVRTGEGARVEQSWQRLADCLVVDDLAAAAAAIVTAQRSAESPQSVPGYRDRSAGR